MSDCEQCAALRAEIERLKEQLESPFMDGYETAKEEYRPLLIAAEAEVERLTAERDRQYDQNAEQITRIAALEAENEKLRAALSGVLWMAEEWFKHGGDETTFADDYEAKLEAARATITKGEREV